MHSRYHIHLEREGGREYSGKKHVVLLEQKAIYRIMLADSSYLDPSCPKLLGGSLGCETRNRVTCL